MDNRPQRPLGDSRVRIALNECQHGGVEIKHLEYLRDAGARNAQAAREFSFGFTALFHGASPFARAAYRIGTPALARRGWPQWFRWLIPGETVATLTVDSLPAAIKVKGNIEFEAVRKITRFGEPTQYPSEPSPLVPTPRFGEAPADASVYLQYQFPVPDLGSLEKQAYELLLLERAEVREDAAKVMKAGENIVGRNASQIHVAMFEYPAGTSARLGA